MLLYEVTVDGEAATIVTAEALIEAWGDSVPDLVARALELAVASSATLLSRPCVVVRRVR